MSRETIVCQGQCRSGSICLPFKSNMLSSSVRRLGESKCQHWRDICLASQSDDFEIPCRRLIYIKLLWFCKVLCLLGYLFSWDHRWHSLKTLCARVLCIISVQTNQTLRVFWDLCSAKHCRDLPHLFCKPCSFKLCSPQVTRSIHQPSWLAVTIIWLPSIWLLLAGRVEFLNASEFQNVSGSCAILMRS